MYSVQKFKQLLLLEQSWRKSSGFGTLKKSSIRYHNHAIPIYEFSELSILLLIAQNSSKVFIMRRYLHKS